MSDRTLPTLNRCRPLMVALLLAAGLGVATAGEFSPRPEINERGGHIGYTLPRHYSLLIPGRETRFFGGAVFSYAPDVEATLHDLGGGVVLIQNLAGDRITGAFQVDLASRLEAVYRLPVGRENPTGAPAGCFIETEPYPRVAGALDLRFITADQYHFPERAFAARIGGALAVGFTDDPYATAHLTGSLQAVVPVLTPVVQVDLSARYRASFDPGWLDGPAPASALSYLDLRGYIGTERFAHGAAVSAAVAARLPFEFYLPMSAGVGAYVDAGRVSNSVAGVVPGLAAEGTDAAGAAVIGGFLEFRLLAPFRIGSLAVSAGTGAMVSGWTPAGPWLRIDYRTGWFFADPL